MCDESRPSINHGDSLVSEFSVDRAAQRNIESMAQQQLSEASEKAENLQRIDDLEKQLLEKNAEIEECQKTIKAQEEDIAKAHKLIKGFRKLMPEELDGTKFNWSNIDIDDKNLWAKKLYTDLKQIDRNWKSDRVLFDAINNFIARAGVSETPSIIADRLEADRQLIAADFEGFSSASIDDKTVEESFNASVAANIDLVLNGSLMPSDIEQMKATFSGFRNVCSQMFQQLQGTASFLEKLIRSLEDDEDENAKKLLAKIRSIQLNLNVSMQNASTMISDAHVAEKSLSVALDRSIRLSMAPNSQTLALTEKILDLEKMYAEVVKEVQALTAENAKIAELEARCEETVKELQTLNAAKEDFINLQKLYSESLKKVQTLTSENKKLKQEASQAAEKAANLENVVHAKEDKISTLMEDKKKGEERSRNIVPDILQEMQNIKGTLENVSNEAKKMSAIRKNKK